MRYIGGIDIFFLILMLVQGAIVGVVDARYFTKKKQFSASRKARIIGFSFIGIGVVLYLINSFI